MTAVTREPQTPAALIALARSRRMQRALAHAYLHRHEPLPTLRSSLGYMTATTRVTGDDAARGHCMTVLGLSRFDGIAYVVEELGGDAAPIVYRLYLRGPRQGHLVPLHAWCDPAAELRAKIAALAPTLEPAPPTAREAWMLSTRIVQRRALRLPGPAARPIRKLTLQLVVEPVRGDGPSGHSTVTAFLRPHAQLAEVWALPAGTGGAAELAIARVTFTGVPCGTGLAKDTMLLLSSEPLGAAPDAPRDPRDSPG